MKATIPMSLAVVFCTFFSTENASVLPSDTNEANIIETSNEDATTNKSGLEFTVSVASINTKYSEFASGIFRNKLIMVSSKKIGGFGNGIDDQTNEPYTELFCLDVEANGKLSNPLFFSRILNTKHNEGQVAFSPDEYTIYYTRSERGNSKNYRLYKAELEPYSHGNWINETLLTFNSNYSIENPNISSDGKQLFFSSNKPGGLGGFDLYVADILEDGSLGVPYNLGPTVNTIKDEKYPFINPDNDRLYFSSNGHKGLGGYDIFMSKTIGQDFERPINLGRDINSSYDELGLLFISEEQGYFSSNKNGGEGSFDLYNFKAKPIAQTFQGIIVDTQTNQPIPDSKVVLLDTNGKEISTQTTGVDAHFSFSIRAFENYKLKILKQGFESYEYAFESNNANIETYKEVLRLSSKN
ncbi:MAG: PD40 domain-containing protein [Bacteroidia bacterium]|nr:PD40 domain-containing protein [Bacteroidia bacterium]NND24402.1 hypothetical protein [Flavobacteriaceae bacterium]MBT8279774.1 PD40 domain-containing protein [Bacteroidia bacterium]NNK59883.1 hypothetical protein [Flavobacteriaceae bacterium]NNL32751.1 hypothetical protein [Flavobacteriaceae bacterium]